MLLVTKGHHEFDESKTPDRDQVNEIGKVSVVNIYSHYARQKCVRL